MRKLLGTVLCLAVVALGVLPTKSSASRIDELQQKIDERNKTIAALELEIKIYTAQVTETGKQTKTLQTTIKTLDLN
jgi:peptidoglycan hydrolase CwlO-like protein